MKNVSRVYQKIVFIGSKAYESYFVIDSIFRYFFVFILISPSKPSLDTGRLWLDSLNLMTRSVLQRQMKLEDSLENVSKVVYHEFDERRAAEQKSLAESQKINRQKVAITKRLWQYQKRFLTSERGAWFLK